MNINIKKLFLSLVFSFISVISLSGCSSLNLKHVHEFNEEGVMVQEATCTEGGIIRHSCTANDWSYEEKTEPLGHLFDETVLLEASCTTTGKGYRVCTRCNTIENYTIPALGHDYSVLVSKAVDRGCLKDGKTALYKCSRCSSTRGGETIKAYGSHNFKENTSKRVNATCHSEGKKVYYCTRCNEEKTEKIEMIPHTRDKESDGGICTVCKSENIVTDYYTTGLTFEITSETNKECVVSKYSGSSQTPIIQETYLGYKIVGIGSYAFSSGEASKTTITQVTLGDNITYIGEYAFTSKSSLKTIYLDNIVSVGDNAFSSCSSLTDIGNTSKISSIGKSAFSGTQISSFNLSTSLTTIKESTFSSCERLTSITIPSAVTSIGVNAFFKTGLTSATFAFSTGWKAGETELDLNDATNNATYLTKTYVNSTWTKSN